MTHKEYKLLAAKKFSERKKLVNQVIKANENLEDLPLLNWVMNQLLRSARTIDLLDLSGHHPAAMGCDASANVILKRLIKTKDGWDLVYLTNPSLLRGHRKPKV